MTTIPLPNHKQHTLKTKLNIPINIIKPFLNTILKTAYVPIQFYCKFTTYYEKHLFLNLTVKAKNKFLPLQGILRSRLFVMNI